MQKLEEYLENKYLEQKWRNIHQREWDLLANKQQLFPEDKKHKEMNKDS